MAKKRKKSAALPKRLAGVKIPKRVRKGPLGDFMASPAGKLVVAEMVAAAGGALMKRDLDKHPERKRALKNKAGAVGEAASDAVHSTEHAGANIALAITEAARTFGRVLRHGGDEPQAPPPRLTPGQVGAHGPAAGQA
ncbi:MAG TPA: hypothetical protein VD906_04380 [Caulobacteraceae bacterium]|nr:hypothetical protein [Caulobacteraceae bacterium]